MASFIKVKNTRRGLVLNGKVINSMLNMLSFRDLWYLLVGMSTKLLYTWFLNQRVMASDLELGVISRSTVVEIIV